MAQNKPRFGHTGYYCLDKDNLHILKTSVFYVLEVKKPACCPPYASPLGRLPIAYGLGLYSLGLEYHEGNLYYKNMQSVLTTFKNASCPDHLLILKTTR